MGAEINGENGTVDIINVLGHDDIRGNGKKLNIHRYELVAVSDDQEVFTIPFNYIEGDDITLIVDNVTYVKNSGFTVLGNQITLDDTIPAVDAGDKFYVIG